MTIQEEFIKFANFSKQVSIFGKTIDTITSTSRTNKTNNIHMKTKRILALALLMGSYSYGQTLENAIQKTEYERYDLAAKEFRTLITQEPTNPEIYFYYGENYLKNDNLDSANICWIKGNSIDPENNLLLVGIGKGQWLNGEKDKAKANFELALKESKSKDPEVLRRIAETYIVAENKELDLAIGLLELAIKYDPKNEENHLLMGDALLAKSPRNGSPAIACYNKALALNPKSSKGLVRTAKLYQSARNYELANSKYKDAQALNPTYAPAYRENAELYMMFDKADQAIENWKKYLELNNSTDARYRYATSLFQGKKYCEAITELKTVQKEGFNNFYVQRMNAYAYYECEGEGEDATENAKKGLEAMDNFFKIVPKDKIIAMDYSYKGKLYLKTGNDSLGIMNLEKAYEMDPENNGDNLSIIAKMYNDAKDYDNAILYYNKKLNGDINNLTSQEYYSLGKAYYFGPEDYQMADSTFTVLILKAETFGPAYIWKGRSQLKLDTMNQYLAKGAYEGFINSLTPEQKESSAYKSMILEASRYLGDYFYSSENKDIEQAKIYWTMVQTLEPEDKQAATFFATPEGRK
jgi:tetratricopeptide (TPR) repeat protein